MKREIESLLLLPDDLPFAKRLIATAAGAVLTRISARHSQSWDHALAHGHAKGYAAGQVKGSADGRKVGYESGYADGHASGKIEGFKAGREEGFIAGRKILEIRDLRDRQNVRPLTDEFLFDDWRLPITPAIEERIRADVRRLLPEKKQPTDGQWEMILSRTPSSYVVAGAGSGKSTTLILRLLLLHHYLKFEWGSITVVTFTSMSRREFIEKLLEMTQLWKVNLFESTAELVVNTFHSKILKFVRALAERDVVAFEFFGHKDAEALASKAMDNPFETRLNKEQRRLLNECYTQLYLANASFRELIGRLYHDSLTLDKENVDTEQAKRRYRARKRISEQDKEVMDLVERAWTAAGKWPIKGVEPKRETVYLNKLPFQVHGRIAANRDIAVVLLPDSIPGKEETRPGSNYPVWREMDGKKMLFDAYSDQKVVWVDAATDLELYVEWLADQATIAPTFDFQLKGDLSRSPLLDCFVNAAAFIENLGLNVTNTIAKMAFKPNDPDGRFFEALGIFWPAFMSHLENQTTPVMTFNRMFATFGEGCGETLKILPDTLIRSMSHLMIDEFQDVSPQIVSWIKAVLEEVRRRGPELSENRSARHSSLLCVGDDWQSIYGWRGSSPKYFIEFESEFKSRATTPIMLRENFRSHQHVINAAEHIVRDASSIPGKKAISSGPAAAFPVPVRIMDQSDADLVALVAQHYEAGESVMVLYREGGQVEKNRLKGLLAQTYQEDQQLKGKKRRLRIMTIHKSKGLEADAVIILGDCKFKKTSPYKNMVYTIAKLGPKNEALPYDASQKEELLRLAYVGITRAARHCYWFIPQEKSPSSKPKASDKLAANVPYFHDARQVR